MVPNNLHFTRQPIKYLTTFHSETIENHFQIFILCEWIQLANK